MERPINDLDTILAEIGQFGMLQTLNFILICFPMVYSGMELNYFFTASGVEQRCRIDECDPEDTTAPAFLPLWIDNSVPFESGVPSKCTRYKLSNSKDTSTSYIDNNSKNSNSSPFCPGNMFDQTATESCSEFIYKTEEKTIATEWGLSCPNDAWKLAAIGTLHNFGQLIGVPTGGYVSDRYGRRKVLALAGTLGASMSIIQSFSINYAMFAVFEVLSAAFWCTVYPTVMVLALELVRPTKRPLFTCILTAFYPLGAVAMGVVAKHVPNWRHFLRFLFIPGLLHIIYFWIISESIRWLLAKGRYDVAIRDLKKAANFNKTPLSEESIEKFSLYCELHKETSRRVSGKSYPIRHAFTSRKLFWRISICSFCWFAIFLNYYGLSLNSVSLVGNKHLNFILVSLMEGPASLVFYFAANSMGRRSSQSCFLIASGVACLSSYLVNNNHPWLAFALYLFGKLAASASLINMVVYTSELFPTNLRQSLFSFCAMFGQIGSMIAPQTPLLAQTFPSLPLIIFGSCGIASGLLVLKFPETSDVTLPMTVDDAENVGNDVTETTETENI
ncbi:unnamed protein product [Hermetia illucens]|uniref:Major facilitator superfamily (MFS) profile domain-containing protein n=1 Tax=Hermetia illucens TaxID=343691 RepID=A0A7R8UIS1_HERIL|nr:solute carrier family 22 member 4-like [Hermetia illucens]CAD7081409.1 unnamed protein product [Hermetia illucens]